jgi:hypothetical protein
MPAARAKSATSETERASYPSRAVETAGSRTAGPVIGVRERESWTPYRLDVSVVGPRTVGNTHSRSVRKTPSPMPNAELQRSMT